MRAATPNRQLRVEHTRSSSSGDRSFPVGLRSDTDFKVATGTGRYRTFDRLFRTFASTCGRSPYTLAWSLVMFLFHPAYPSLFLYSYRLDRNQRYQLPN